MKEKITLTLTGLGLWVVVTYLTWSMYLSILLICQDALHRKAAILAHQGEIVIPIIITAGSLLASVVYGLIKG